MSKVVIFEEIGAKEVLQFVIEDDVYPSYGEVQIEVHAFGINRSEISFREGEYIQYPEFPARIGYEASGIITAVGDGVNDWKVGDFVSTLPLIEMSRNGVWGEIAVVPAKSLVANPVDMSFQDAAAGWIAFTTAWGGLLEVGQLRKGDFVLITAWAGSPALAAIQIARSIGAIPIVTTRTMEKRNDLLELGAAHVIVTEDENLVVRVQEITEGRGANLIFDCISGSILMDLGKAAAIGGRIVVYGMLAHDPTPFPIYEAFEKGLSIHGYTIAEVLNSPERWSRARSFLTKGFKDGTLTPTISKVFDFEELMSAIGYMETGKKVGKVVVSVK